MVSEAHGQALTDLVGADAMLSASPNDAIDGVGPALVVEPTSIDDAARVLAWANDAGLKVAPRGGGTRLGWGNPPESLDLVLSTRRLNRLVEHASGDMTATLEAGLTLAELQRQLATADQQLSFDPPFDERATLGGLIATDDSGPLRLRYGGLRDLIIGITVIRADGVLAKGGGKVVKNVAGYDLPKLFTGSLGTLGLIAEATFRLHPLPRASATFKLAAPTAQAATAFVVDLLGSTLAPTGLTLRWQPADSELLIRFAGTVPAVEEQLEALGAFVKRHALRATSLAPEQDAAAWRELGELPWQGGPDALVARCSVLPTEIPAALAAFDETGRSHRLLPTAVIQAHGLGLLRLDPGESSTPVDLEQAANELRHRLAPRDGTLVLLAAPVDLKRRLDVWGLPADTLPLMRRLRNNFDPRGTLNPGRLVPLAAPMEVRVA